VRSTGPLLARRGFVAASILAFAFFGYGCGGSDNASFSAQFTPSATAPAVDLVKLVQKSTSGGRIVVQAVIYGPDASLDMFSFAFDVKIGDPTVLKFVAGSAVEGNALTVSGGQTITVQAGPDQADPTHIVVGVTKVGGGLGNGVGGSIANPVSIVSLTFQPLKQGTSTLAIAAGPTAPTVLDSDGDPIGAITFDTANGTVTAISTGGGY
jgi:hypothetical protein